MPFEIRVCGEYVYIGTVFCIRFQTEEDVLEFVKSLIIECAGIPH